MASLRRPSTDIASYLGKLVGKRAIFQVRLKAGVGWERGRLATSIH